MPPWRLWDPRVLTEQARRQGMRLRWDNKHYLPIAYEVTESHNMEAAQLPAASGNARFGHSRLTGAMCSRQPGSGKHCCFLHLWPLVDASCLTFSPCAQTCEPPSCRCRAGDAHGAAQHGVRRGAAVCRPCGARRTGGCHCGLSHHGPTAAPGSCPTGGPIEQVAIPAHIRSCSICGWCWGGGPHMHEVISGAPSLKM